MVNSQSCSYILAGVIERTESENQGNEVGDQEEDSILFDDGMCLWGWGGQLFGRVEEEV